MLNCHYERNIFLIVDDFLSNNLVAAKCVCCWLLPTLELYKMADNMYSITCTQLYSVKSFNDYHSSFLQLNRLSFILGKCPNCSLLRSKPDSKWLWPMKNLQQYCWINMSNFWGLTTIDSLNLLIWWYPYNWYGAVRWVEDLTLSLLLFSYPSPFFLWLRIRHFFFPLLMIHLLKSSFSTLTLSLWSSCWSSYLLGTCIKMMWGPPWGLPFANALSVNFIWTIMHHVSLTETLDRVL